MLRKIRIASAVVCFALVTLLFLDFTGTLHAWFGWLAQIQLLPALLALNVGVVAALAVLTLLFGRVYCSVICPLGVMQDVVSWLAGRRRKNRFAWSPARQWLRGTMLAVFVAALAAGIGSIVALLAPYSAYGRIAANLFASIYQLGNNLAAYAAERVGSYAFYSVDVWVKNAATLGVAALTFAGIGLLAWRSGRTWCNTVCPVGTVLGVLARYSLFKVRIDASKCNGCKLCARNCKAACIDPEAHSVDYTRCVACMDCLDKCRQGAIGYTLRRTAQKRAPHEVDLSRRRFFALAGLLAWSALRAQEKKVDGGLAVIAEKKAPHRTTPITPPGSLGARNMAAHCTGCQLCVSVCPNAVLRPSGGLVTLMQPEVSYERGYCRPECTKCSEVCPTDAIRPLTAADKSATQIGHAVWIRENCVVLTDDVACDNCARHCPAAAIHMVPVDASDPASRRIPAVNEERCIGCGACENLCPARPFSAIYVEGHARHRTV